MNDFEAIIDFGSKNLRLDVIDKTSKKIYSSDQIITDNIETSLNIIVKRDIPAGRFKKSASSFVFIEIPPLFRSVGPESLPEATPELSIVIADVPLVCCI